MLAAVLLPVVLLAAPEDEARTKLRIAWASLYEWRESDVRNVTLPYSYSKVRTTAEKEETLYTGSAEVVLVDGAVVRRHSPAAPKAQRAEIDRHLDWVVRRFVREPFEKRFPQGTRFTLTRLEDGTERIGVGAIGLLLREGRLVGMERFVRRDLTAREEFELAEMAGGYTIVASKLRYVAETDEVEEARRLEWKLQGDVPVPASYVHRVRWTRREEGQEPATFLSTVRLEFGAVKVNTAHPVVVDPAARDALEAAWKRRYTLPDAIRIQGRFERRVDKNLRLQRWRADVDGEFLIWGIQERSLVVDERGYNDERKLEQDADTARKHFDWFFELLRARPFAEEFRNCGFAFGGEPGVVAVTGYAHALAFRIDDKGRLAGWQANVPGDTGWWTLDLKTRDGRDRIDGLSRRLGDETRVLRFRYTRMKGLDVPKSFEAFAGNGVCTYTFKKLTVDLPEGG